MFVHAVFFYCKKGISKKTLDQFLTGLRDLAIIESVDSLFVGTPPPSDDPVVRTDFTAALTVLFKDRAAHDRYQVDEVHCGFIEQFADLWEKVEAFDSEC